MENENIIIMLKDPETGLIESELDSFHIDGATGLLVSAFAYNGGGGVALCLRLGCGRAELEDWEFDAVFDCYEDTALAAEGFCLSEAEDCGDPEWILSFPLPDDHEKAETMINRALELHSRELFEVFGTLGDMREDAP